MKPEEVQGRRTSADISRRSAIWPHGPDPALLGAPPYRPVVNNGYERQFVYVYGAVSPIEGELDWMICREMNTERMSEFLGASRSRTPAEFMVMVVDGASSHVAKDLVVPENIRLLRLPAYAPELNPQEHVWDEIREKQFPNRVFQSWPALPINSNMACHSWLPTMNACEV